MLIEKKKIGIIGCGNMSRAILHGLLTKIPAENLTVSDASESQLAAIAQTGVHTTTDNTQTVKGSDIVILAVKPNIYPAVLKEISQFTDKLYITIAPGLSIAYIKSFFASPVRVVRTMPNMPAQVNQGMTVYATGEVGEDITCAEEILSCLGRFIRINEHLMDAAVGVNGSGPAYVFVMIEAMADEAVLQGIPRKDAYVLAAQTVLGSAAMVLETGLHPAELKDMVCSPGGTTIEAIASLEQSGFRSSLIKAMKRCTEKSEKLSK